MSAWWHSAAGFGLVLARIGAFVMACPPFVPEGVAMRVRAAAIGVLSLALYLALPSVVIPRDLLMAGVLEILYGTAMGLVLRLAAVPLSYAGEILDFHVGFSFAQQVNAMSAEHVGPLQSLSQLIAGLVFFAAGAQHATLRALAGSLRRVPPGTALWHSASAATLTHTVGELFITALRIGMPLMAALMGTQLFLAMISRVAPQLNIWGVGFAITALVGIVGLLALAPAWVATAATLWDDALERLPAVGVR